MDGPGKRRWSEALPARCSPARPRPIPKPYATREDLSPKWCMIDIALQAMRSHADSETIRIRLISIPSSGGLRDLVSECASGDLVDQSPRGDLRAIGAHRGGDGAGTGRHVLLESVAERFGQRVGSGRAGHVRGSDPEVVDSLCPVVLVVHL